MPCYNTACNGEVVDAADIGPFNHVLLSLWSRSRRVCKEAFCLWQLCWSHPAHHFGYVLDEILGPEHRSALAAFRRIWLFHAHVPRHACITLIQLQIVPAACLDSVAILEIGLIKPTYQAVVTNTAGRRMNFCEACLVNVPETCEAHNRQLVTFAVWVFVVGYLPTLCYYLASLLVLSDRTWRCLTRHRLVAGSGWSSV